MKKIEFILPSVLNKYSLSDSGRSARVAQVFKSFFIENWGEGDWKEVGLVKFKNASLVILVSSPVWANQIFLHKEGIIEYILGKIEGIKLESVVAKVV